MGGGQDGSRRLEIRERRLRDGSKGFEKGETCRDVSLGLSG